MRRIPQGAIAFAVFVVAVSVLIAAGFWMDTNDANQPSPAEYRQSCIDRGGTVVEDYQGHMTECILDGPT